MTAGCCQLIPDLFTYLVPALGARLRQCIMLGIEIDVSSQLGQNEIPVWFGLVNNASLAA